MAELMIGGSALAKSEKPDIEWEIGSELISVYDIKKVEGGNHAEATVVISAVDVDNFIFGQKEPVNLSFIIQFVIDCRYGSYIAPEASAYITDENFDNAQELFYLNLRADHELLKQTPFRNMTQGMFNQFGEFGENIARAACKVY